MAAACSFNSYYSSSHVPCLCGHLIQNTAPASHGPECLLWLSPCRIILFLSQCSCLYRVPLDWFLSLTSSFCFSSWSQHCQDGSWCHHRVQNQSEYICVGRSGYSSYAELTLHHGTSGKNYQQDELLSCVGVFRLCDEVQLCRCAKHPWHSSISVSLLTEEAASDPSHSFNVWRCFPHSVVELMEVKHRKNTTWSCIHSKQMFGLQISETVVKQLNRMLDYFWCDLIFILRSTWSRQCW